MSCLRGCFSVYFWPQSSSWDRQTDGQTNTHRRFLFFPPPFSRELFANVNKWKHKQLCRTIEESQYAMMQTSCDQALAKQKATREFPFLANTDRCGRLLYTVLVVGQDAIRLQILVCFLTVSAALHLCLRLSFPSTAVLSGQCFPTPPRPPPLSLPLLWSPGTLFHASFRGASAGAGRRDHSQAVPPLPIGGGGNRGEGKAFISIRFSRGL